MSVATIDYEIGDLVQWIDPLYSAYDEPDPKYMKVYGVLVGRKPIIFTNNDSAYDTAIEFKKNGVDFLVNIKFNKNFSRIQIENEVKNLLGIKKAAQIVKDKGYKFLQRKVFGFLKENSYNPVFLLFLKLPLADLMMRIIGVFFLLF